MSFNPEEYLFNLQHFGVKLGLDRMQRLVELLGHPETKFPSIHVAGTNGKGSTSAMLSSVFKKQGLKVGLYTSPHLVNFCERIQINGKNISKKELLDLTLEIKEKLDAAGENEATFFEVTTAVAFLYFAGQEVDIAIIEVGLGGRLDATNVVKPLVSVITNIDLDHTKVLGDNRISIAKEKAGIIKNAVPLVTCEQNLELINIFKEFCDSNASSMFQVSVDYQLVESNLEKQKFIFENEEYCLSMLGEHQIKNAMTVIKAVEVLNQLDYGIKVTDRSLKQGLLDAKWPGRLQFYSKQPVVLFEGAHNAAGMQELDSFLSKHQDELFAAEESICIVGISFGKDAKLMLEKLSKYFSSIIVTEASHRAIPVNELAVVAKKYFASVETCEISVAMDLAKSKVAESGFILVSGSLYVVGDVLKSCNKKIASDGLNLTGAKGNV
ncbi:bifunctional folylpolyglutamate synthase/dihydrofolate synthase [archaeon]|jgi:dihydrofolate synthase / folylpolyglutamate synthase|nr:bifunctional folylpolyglutamate synthase/dihydrofolate synthase [archaeon]MBT6762610.1 bifunctional folylpolyglutamate synthase/dihydrofolate synthase [archaeon]